MAKWQVFHPLKPSRTRHQGVSQTWGAPNFLKSNRWIAKLEPRGACPIGGVFVNHLRLWHWADDTSYPAQLNDPLPLGFYGRCIFVVSWFNDVSPWTLLPSKKKGSIANWTPYITDSVGKWCLLFSWHDMTSCFPQQACREGIFPPVRVDKDWLRRLKEGSGRVRRNPRDRSSSAVS